VPEAIIAFLDSSDYEETLRLAISLGGDTDTLACIAGGIAEAFYGGVPKDIAELREVVRLFTERYGGSMASQGNEAVEPLELKMPHDGPSVINVRFAGIGAAGQTWGTVAAQ